MVFKIINILKKSAQICHMIFLDPKHQLISVCLLFSCGFKLLSYHVNTIKKET